MAQYWGQRVVTATSASVATVDLVYLASPGMSVRVTNLSGNYPLYFTVSRPGGDCPVPTVGGTTDYCAASVAGTNVNVRHDGMFGSVVQLIATGATQYSVEVQGQHATS